MPRKQSDEQAGIIQKIMTIFPHIDQDEATRLYEAAQKGGEISRFGSIDEWLERKVKFGGVTLDQEDYLVALTHALRLAPFLAGTDFGTTRQRDLGQLWTDVTKGFLGEIGVAKFIKRRFGYEVILDYSKGPLEDYLASDIKQIRLPNGNTLDPRFNISIKTTKFSGVWLDIPGAQFEHSEVFVLVKLGITRSHFIAFLKSISFLRDKLLPTALASGVINDSEAERLWESLPTFNPIPCYVVGFLDKRNVPSVVPKFKTESKATSVKYVMQEYVGWVKGGKPEQIDDALSNSQWEFESIRNFSPSPHFVANVGLLAYSEDDWKRLLRDLAGG